MCVQLMSRNEAEVPEIDDRDPDCQCVLEICQVCDLSEAWSCPACNGRGWILFNARASE